MGSPLRRVGGGLTWTNGEVRIAIKMRLLERLRKGPWKDVETDRSLRLAKKVLCLDVRS